MPWGSPRREHPGSRQSLWLQGPLGAAAPGHSGLTLLWVVGPLRAVGWDWPERDVVNVALVPLGVLSGLPLSPVPAAASRTLSLSCRGQCPKGWAWGWRGGFGLPSTPCLCVNGHDTLVSPGPSPVGPHLLQRAVPEEVSVGLVPG